MTLLILRHAHAYRVGLTMAPVFDNGSCLLPQADERIMALMLEDETELNARILIFPNSMLKVNGRKINYHDYICGNHEQQLTESLSYLMPKIAALDFEEIVARVPFLGDLQRRFYSVYLNARREKIFNLR